MLLKLIPDKLKQIKKLINFIKINRRLWKAI